MSKRVSGIIRFASHDDLVVAYHRGLAQGVAQLRTARLLQPGDELIVSLELSSSGAKRELSARVEQCQPIEDRPGRFTCKARLDAEDIALIEDFIVTNDPSLAQQRASVLVPRKPFKVVVVDDSPAQAKFASEPFLKRGDEVFLAEDGLSGLALCIKHEPDIVLSDVQMPKADGWTMLRMLRARKQLARTPVIFLTTLGGEEDRLKGYRLGVDDYLEKPYSQHVLMARVERLLQRARSPVNSWLPGKAGGLRGDLEQVGLPALLSFLELERKSGVIYLEPKGSLIMLEQGRPVRAKSPDKDSVTCREAALFALLDLNRGRFEFVPGDVTETDSIQSSLGAILLEHARLADENARA